MRFLFATDLHGDIGRYLKLGNSASELGASAIVIGGDIAPKFGNDLFKEQHDFYGWMQEWADDLMVPVYAYLGNDDVKCLMPTFLAECFRSNNLHPLNDLGSIEGYTYARYNYVPDTPFGLKDWSKRDYAGWVSPPQLSNYAVVSESAKTKVPFHKDPYRYKILKDPTKFLQNRTTIQQDLKTFNGVDILFAHCPPADLSLDVCYGGDRPGSRAILEWIDRMHPAITLHGHIHESYQCTGIWRVTRGSTEVIQPGSRHFVVVDIERDEVTGKCEVHTKLVPY